MMRMKTRLRMRRTVFVGLCWLLLVLASFLAGIRVTQVLTVTHDAPIAAGKLFSADLPLKLESLRSITTAAATDAEALSAVRRYFETNEQSLSIVFGESNPARLRGLFAMYAGHVSHLYGVHPVDDGFLAWLRDPEADCQSYADNQALILTALGVRWREIGISGGTHVFIEAAIDGDWEVFDATVNEWLSRPAFELERGAARSYRALWSPMDDSASTESYQPGMQAAVQDLRISMKGLGLYWFPKAYLFVAASG